MGGASSVGAFRCAGSLVPGRRRRQAGGRKEQRVIARRRNIPRPAVSRVRPCRSYVGRLSGGTAFTERFVSGGRHCHGRQYHDWAGSARARSLRRPVQCRCRLARPVRADPAGRQRWLRSSAPRERVTLAEDHAQPPAATASAAGLEVVAAVRARVPGARSPPEADAGRPLRCAAAQRPTPRRRAGKLGGKRKQACRASWTS